jgi:hypothetical protein
MALRFDEMQQYTKYEAPTKREPVSLLRTENYPATRGPLYAFRFALKGRDSSFGVWDKKLRLKKICPIGFSE